MANEKTLSERKAFLRIIMIIASSDGVLSDDEMQLFYQRGKEFKVSSEELDSIRNSIPTDVDSLVQLEDACALISSGATKHKLLWELIELCYADGEYSEQEAAGMKVICTFLNLNESDLDKIEKAFLIKSKSKAKFLSEAEKLLSVSKSTGKAIGTTIASGTKKASHMIAHGVTSIGSKINVTLEIAKKAKEENRQLRERLKEETVTEAVKQKVIQKLGNKIHILSMQLSEEKKRNEQNEEMIELLQAQIDDLKLTLEAAKNVQPID